MVQVPAIQNNPNFIAYPVFVYNGGPGAGDQVSYLYSPHVKMTVGTYVSGQTSGIYQFYFFDINRGWLSCHITLTAGRIDANKLATTCLGATLSRDPKFTNAWVLSTSSSNVAGWSIMNNPLHPSGYNKRHIIFNNNTSFWLQIGKSYCPNFSTCDNRQTNDSYQKIAPSASFIEKLGNAGLNSAVYYLSGYCFANCGSPQSWFQVGSLNQHSYATKIEITMFPATEQNGMFLPQGESRFRDSVAGGFSGIAAMTVIPFDSSNQSRGAYCKTLVSPGVSKVDYYSPDHVLAGIFTPNNDSLSSFCAASSYTSASGQSWSLSVIDSTTGEFNGCLSPCSYAKLYSTPDQKAACSVPKAYATNMTNSQHSPIEGVQFKNVHVVAKDHAHQLSCPAETGFIVNFMPAALPNSLSVPVINSAQPQGLDGAVVSWQSARDSLQPNQTINYTLQLTLPNNSPISPTPTISYDSNEATVTGLASGQTYKAVVVANDMSVYNAQQSNQSAPTIFTTYNFTSPTSVAATNLMPTSATINWTPSIDTLPNSTVHYTVNISTSSGALPGILTVPTDSTSATINNFPTQSSNPYVTYYAMVSAATTDAAGKVYTQNSDWIPFNIPGQPWLSAPVLTGKSAGSEFDTIDWQISSAKPSSFSPDMTQESNYQFTRDGASIIPTSSKCSGGICTTLFSRQRGDHSMHTYTITGVASSQYGQVSSAPLTVQIQ